MGQRYAGLLGLICTSLIWMTCGAQAQAADGSSVNWSGSGFMTLGAGKMLGGTQGQVRDLHCPCFVADYAQNGVYDGRGGIQFAPDSKLGLQGSANLPDSGLSVTAQAVSRGSRNGRVNLEWLYATYQLDDQTSIQLGRKRLPMFYYSDTQDVGFALPWTHLPPQQYGWEAVNYNGVNIQHRGQVGEWDVNVNVLAGSENFKDSGYWNIYNGQTTRTDVTWDNIVGGNVSLARAWFEARLVYLQSKTKRRNTTGVWDANLQAMVSATDPDLQGRETQQKIYAAAFNVDYADWLLLSEWLYIDRPGATFRDHAQLLGAGRRLGDWELYVNFSAYRGEAVVAMGGDPQGQESHESRSLTLRYNLSANSDIKMQVDAQQERGGVNWSPRYGDSQLLTLAYDRIF